MKKTLKDGDIINLGAKKFTVERRKINSCAGCNAGALCKEVFRQYATGSQVGCQNLIFVEIIEEEK